MIKLESFKRAVKARKKQQVQQQQQKEESIQTVAKYWADSINNAKPVHGILSIQQWMSSMVANVQTAHQLENDVGPSNPPPNVEDHNSNEEEIAIEISSAHMFGFDEDKFDDVKQPLPSDDFTMIMYNEELIGS